MFPLTEVVPAFIDVFVQRARQFVLGSQFLPQFSEQLLVPVLVHLLQNVLLELVLNHG